MTDPDSKPSPLWIWFSIILCSLLGTLMLLQGLGIISVAWLNPNPDVPPFIFSVIGLILLITVPLLLAHLRRINTSIINLAGYSVLALAFIVVHWMVFFAKGASCSLEGITLALGLPDFICTGIFGLVLALIDLIALLIAGRAALRWFSSTARS